MHRSDPALVQACLRGDRAAWDRLVDQYGRLVYSIAHRYGLEEGDADDVFQAVFLVLFRRLETLKDQTRLSAWLITTTHRECWRIGRRSEVPGLEETITDLGEPSEEQSERWERQHLVRLGLERLGGRCQELLQALFLEGAETGYESIAARLGMPVGSIGPTRARCFAKLERILSELGVEGPLPAETLPDES
ncbi:MAG: RNA polymerase sigma factor [Planctomycetota bacterium]